MASIHFEIRHPNGKREAAHVEADRALIGSASFADVRLPMEEASPEHVRVSVVGGRLYFEALPNEAMVMLDGAPLPAGLAREGNELDIGGLRVKVSSTGPARIQAPSEQASRARLGAFVLVGVMAALALFLVRRGGAPLAPPADQTVELFSALEPSCPKREPRQALAFAAEQLDLGATKQERMPFAIQEGIAAVDLYETAAGCFRAAQQSARATAARDAAQSLKRNLEGDLRARRLRLSHMLKVQDHELARVDVLWLSALTRGKSAPYVAWLDQVGQELALTEAK